MKTIALDLPTFAFIVGTRAALAGGVALLLSHKLPEHRRRLVGAALAGVGVLTTVPALVALRRGTRRPAGNSVVNVDERLIGTVRYPRKGDDAFV
jgi:hypothetical protein